VLSVFCALLVVSLPYHKRDTLNTRIKRLAEETERVRLRERGRLAEDDASPRLRRRPRKLFQSIVDKLDLTKHPSVDDCRRTLRMAGYRGEASVVSFLAIRTLAPVAMCVLSSLYVFGIVDLQQPFIIKLLIVSGASLFGYYLPGIFVKNQTIKRQQAMQRAWPDALDLLLICVESGMSIEAAFRKVSEEIAKESAELSEELGLTTAELSYLQDRFQAFENLGQRTGLDGVKAVVASFRQSERHGTSIGRSLRVLAQESRLERISLAEKKAAALPPKLTVPMILFFLPVLFAVLITPAAIQIMEM
jgi:tight adherence protein C